MGTGPQTANDGKRLRWPCFAIRPGRQQGKPAAVLQQADSARQSSCGTTGWLGVGNDNCRPGAATVPIRSRYHASSYAVLSSCSPAG